MKKDKCDDLRLDPADRLCPMFDKDSVKLFAAPDREEMGVRVLDNCAEGTSCKGFINFHQNRPWFY